ncbi:MAG: glutamyl-tRNA reductase [Acidimicrobiales bacterium]
MAVVVVGIHEWDVPLQTFERVALTEPDVAKALMELVASPHLSEAIVLSTCMRTEVYAVLERFHDGLGDIEAFFSDRLGKSTSLARELAESPEMPPEPSAGSFDLGMLSCWYDDAAVSHLFEVAAGIDSPVLGEGEVLRQVRDAAEHARLESAAGPVLTPLFRHAVEAGKRARTETAIQRGAVSLAGAVVDLAEREVGGGGGLAGRKLLLIGAGEMATSIARTLSGRAGSKSHSSRSVSPVGPVGVAARGGSKDGSKYGSRDIVVANRDAGRASYVAEIVGGRVAGLDDLVALLGVTDVVLSATGSDDIILTPELLSEGLARRSRARARGPLVVVDAAVPRDVDSSAAALPGLVLIDLEDVRRHASSQMAGRESEVAAVRTLLSEELERYRTTASGRLAAPVVSALRARAERLRLAELEHYSGQLCDLAESDRELVETITRRVVAKLLHEPTVRVKDAAGSPRGERLAEALRTLFDL